MELEELLKGNRGRKLPLKDLESVTTPRDISGPSDPVKTVPPFAGPHLVAKAAAKAASLDALEQLQQRVHSLLVDKVDPEYLKTIPEDRQRLELRRVIGQILDAENQP